MREYIGDRFFPDDPDWGTLARQCAGEGRPDLVHQAISDTKAADMPPGRVRDKGFYVKARLRDLLRQQFDPRRADPSAVVFTSPAAPK